jgi:hypothetical protein
MPAQQPSIVDAFSKAFNCSELVADSEAVVDSNRSAYKQTFPPAAFGTD